MVNPDAETSILPTRQTQFTTFECLSTPSSLTEKRSAQVIPIQNSFTSFEPLASITEKRGSNVPSLSISFTLIQPSAPLTAQVTPPLSPYSTQLTNLTPHFSETTVSRPHFNIESLGEPTNLKSPEADQAQVRIRMAKQARGRTIFPKKERLCETQVSIQKSDLSFQSNEN